MPRAVIMRGSVVCHLGEAHLGTAARGDILNLLEMRIQHAMTSAPDITAPTETRIMVDMSATLIHHGHIRLLKAAKQLGTVVVALTTDEEIRKKKGYDPELSFEERKEVLEAIRYVDEVVPCNWLIEMDLLDQPPDRPAGSWARTIPTRLPQGQVAHPAAN